MGILDLDMTIKRQKLPKESEVCSVKAEGNQNIEVTFLGKWPFVSHRNPRFGKLQISKTVVSASAVFVASSILFHIEIHSFQNLQF